MEISMQAMQMEQSASEDYRGTVVTGIIQILEFHLNCIKC